jgi:hypothetical protein
MPFTKIDTAGLQADAVDNTILDLASNFAFSGTVTGAGADNKPSFSAFMNAHQSVSHNSATKLQFNTESFDPDGVFDPSSSNYKFTCQTAGYHIFTAQVQQNDSGGKSRQVGTMLFKNGSDAVNGSGSYWDTYNNDTFRESAIRTTAILNLSVNDYVQVYFYQTQSDGHDNTLMTSSAYNVFTGYRIAQ